VNREQAFDTRCIHAGEAPDPTTGAHGVPLYQNVTFAFQSNGDVEAMRAGERPHFTYSPRGNPTVRCFEAKIASLDGAETALALNSGMAAISTVFLAVAAEAGHIVASDHLYDLSRDFLRDELPAVGKSATFVDTADLVAVENAILPESRAIYVEPFSNPDLIVTDVAAMAALAHRHELLLIVDNTFLSPALLQPLALGADLVVHSATKYLSGHGQVQGGVISGPRRLIEPMRARSLLYGTSMTPFAAWMLLSGIHTLPLRMERHSENAMRLARVLATHPEVEFVNYPGLPGHPGHHIAESMVRRDGHRFGGMLSFTLRGGKSAVGRFIDSLELCTIAVSLGDCSTLVWPWYRDDLIRVSVGLEDFRDLEGDFLRALSAAATAEATA
jgi:cystathionine beta-lyase/cystathionine gamma-synthase